MDPQGRKLHGLAAQAREEGDSVKALSLYHSALDAYQKENDSIGFAETLADECISLRHLYEKTADRKWLILAKHTAEASVEIAKNSRKPEALAVPLFNLAKVQQALGELTGAIENYREAIKNIESNPPENHANRPAIVADYKIHMAGCEYKAGDKSALGRMENDLKELENAEELSDYNKHVWLSGAHMRIAEILMPDNPERAKEHLQKAKEIIDADPQLKIRKEQWEKLAEKFS